MTGIVRGQTRKVLIASGHPLFAQGLRSLIQARHARGVEIVGLVSNLDQAITALNALDLDLIILDCDDESMDREEFLAHFVEGEKTLRLVLLSLQHPGQAIVYDRRPLQAHPLESWLD